MRRTAQPSSAKSIHTGQVQIDESSPYSGSDAALSSSESEESEDAGDIAIADALPEEIDPSVLSSLPPSIQLDIITKLREKSMQSNREAFQQRRAEPQSFSSFQLDEYLKASNMRYATSYTVYIINNMRAEPLITAAAW